ncbi:hypothetical protein [Alkalilimnicola sp. S0819]|uniref:hypothetical protein n=1 Tax=Alkalilimnicola sp. S0819 TaxID=2613922 RepID=UPI0018697624|nr:hypothetical protein [Alkalilimnicola sp. S0819]
MTELNAAIALFLLFTAAAALRGLLAAARQRARGLVLGCAALTCAAALAAQASGLPWLMDLLLMILLLLVSAWLLWPRRQPLSRGKLR